MRHNRNPTSLSPSEHAALVQAARAAAVRLHRQAVNDAWQAVMQAVRSALHPKSTQPGHKPAQQLWKA
jgi:hypothetical protein